MTPRAALLALSVTGCLLALAAPACRRGAGPSPSAPTSATPTPAPQTSGCARTSTGLTPLSDLLSGSYHGEPGGLYAGGNTRPASHEAAGLALARRIGPLDASGVPAANGRYALVSIGMSNTTQEFSVFRQLAQADGSRDPRLVVVDGAQGGMTASNWSSPGCACWTTLSDRLRAAGVTDAQVAVVWVKLANAGPSAGWPQETLVLRDHVAAVLRMLKARFPNLLQAYLSSRIYAGYATTTLNPEPYAYESGFAVKWVIDAQIRGTGNLDFGDGRGTAPWLSWGPYLWADGLQPRSDGLIWACADLADDGTHPSTSGRAKVADLLLQFFRTDRTAREWYLASP